jgi:hypothetical protein
MDIPGLIRIERIALANDRNEIVWETRRCRAPDLAHVHEMRDLSGYVEAESGAVWFAQSADPNFELELTDAVRARLAAGGAVLLEMSRLDAADLSALVTLVEMAGALLTTGEPT